LVASAAVLLLAMTLAGAEVRVEGIERRVQAQVAELQKETLAQSLEKLATDGLAYFLPGPSTMGDSAIIGDFPPLDREVGQRNLERILSNRRFLKVFGDFKALDPAQASAVINKQVSADLEEYKAKLEAAIAWTHAGGASRPGQENVPDPYHEVDGLCRRTLVLALVGSNLGLKDCQGLVASVTREALAQRQRFYVGTPEDWSLRLNILFIQSLYNRQILGYALLRTAADEAAASRALAALGTQPVSRRLTTYTAFRTEFDAWLMPGPVDFTQGELVVQYMPPLSDEEFDKLVATLLPAQ
jgi:hypothetical protein